MTEASSSKELTKGSSEQEIAEGTVNLDGVYVAPPPEQSAFYRASVFGVRGILQVFLMMAILVGASFLMTELQESREERPQRAKKEAVYTIETVTAKLFDHQPMISVFGDVVAARSLNLTSLVAGEVVFVNDAFKIGGRVKKGDLLLEINPFSFEIARDEAAANLQEGQAALREAEARLAMEETGRKRAQEQLDLAEKDLERSREIVGQGIVTQRVVEERELVLSQRRAAFQSSGANIEIQMAQIEARRAAVLRAEVILKNAEQELADTKLRASFDAIVQTTDVEIGQSVTTNQTLATLFAADEFDARFVLSDGQYGRLATGDGQLTGRKIKVHWNVGASKTSFPATIDRVGAEVAANRGGVTVFARLDADHLNDALRPGAFVTVDVPDQAFEQTYRLPEIAVFEGDVAYVVGPENRLETRPLDIAVYDGDFVIVKGGLKEGDEVLITQIAEVGPGLLVREEGEDGGAKVVDKEDKLNATSAQKQSNKPRG